MADICMCEDKKCPSRTICYRFTAEKCKYRQSYFLKSPRKKGQMRCEEFVDNAAVATICRCNLMGMEHKRTSACEVFEVICQPKLSQKDISIRDKEGIKSQKHVFKEWDKRFKLGTFAPKMGTVHKPRTKRSRCMKLQSKSMRRKK